MKSWMKYLGVVVGAITAPLLIASVALSVVVEQTGISGKQVYSYDQATGLARMQVVLNDLLIQLGGEHVGAAEEDGYLRVAGGIVRVVEVMTAVTTNTTSAVFTIPSGAKTPRAFVAGTGAVTQTFKLYGAMTDAAVVADATLIGTITLSGTTKHEAGMDSGVQFTADYPYYFAVSSATTGTAATGTFEIHVGTVAAGAAGGGAGDASAANQTTQITALQLLDNIVSGSGANISQINGVTPLMGAGPTGTGSPRTTEANDSQLSAGVGAAADAAATAGSTGSLTAKLRLMTTQLDTISTRVLASIADPCAGAAKILVPISQTTGTQIITGTASMRTYVCAITVMSATAQNIALVSGTGTVCATSIGAMIGGTTAATGWNFAANGGIALGDARGTVAKSDTDADNICILMSSTGQLSGVISYVVAAN